MSNTEKLNATTQGVTTPGLQTQDTPAPGTSNQTAPVVFPRNIMETPTSGTRRFPLLPPVTNADFHWICKQIKDFDDEEPNLEDYITSLNIALDEIGDRPEFIERFYSYVYNRLTANMKRKLNFALLPTCAQLTEKLSLLYADATGIDIRYERLETAKQASNESIKEYYSRIDTMITKCCTTLYHDTNRLGKIEFTTEIGLRRFVKYCNPEIARQLRARKSDIKNLEQALNIALEEEEALKISGKFSKMKISSDKYCKNCKRNNHNTNECRIKRTNNFKSSSYNNNYNSNRNANRNANRNGNFKHSDKPQVKKEVEVCTFCNKVGHTEEQCYKKQNDRKKQDERLRNRCLNIKWDTCDIHSPSVGITDMDSGNDSDDCAVSPCTIRFTKGELN